jgi:hypothetical protein
MATHSKKPEAEFLEQSRVALENAESQTEIATTMAEFGYDAEKIAEGKAIYTETRTAYDLNKTEDDETSEAYANFSNLKQQLYDLHYAHRKKARVVFRGDSLTADKLAITGSLPQAYIKWLESVTKFYTTALADSNIQTKLAKLKVTIEELNAANDLIPQVKTARAEYLKEKGESQDATKAKDAAFAKLDEWMFEFYEVAEIALEDNPQLLEALGLIVKG